MRIFGIWRPNNRSTHCYDRAVGLKVLLCAIALLLGATVHAQPVPDTILLPDSLGPLPGPYHVAFGGSNDDIYVASESSDIIVVEGNTFQRIKRIETGTPVGGVCLVTRHDKLYCSYSAQGRVGIVDCATNGIVGTIQVGAGPKTLCYSSRSDKLYCGDTAAKTISVIDCTSDSLVATIAAGDSLRAIVYDPSTDKVYVATKSVVVAIACQVDSVVARIAEVKATAGLCISGRQQKLYAVRQRGTGMDTLTVISTLDDSVVARTGIAYDGHNLRPFLACNESNDRLYGMVDWVSFPRMVEFDCIGDTWTRYRNVDDYRPLALACDPVRNRLFYLSRDSDRGYLSEYDCTTLEQVSWVQVADYPNILELDTVRRRMLSGGGEPWYSGNEVLSVLECSDDSLALLGAVPLDNWQQLALLCHNPSTSKLYYQWGDGIGGVGVIDELTNCVVAQVEVAGIGSRVEMACSPTSNKVYFVTLSGLAVLDGALDSVIVTVKLSDDGSPPYLCWYPDSNKLYVSARDAGTRRYVAVLKCDTDTIVREIDLASDYYSLIRVGTDRLVCWGAFGHVTLVDCRTDSILVDSVLEANIYAAARSGSDKVYVRRNGRLEARSANTLALLSTTDWPYSRTAWQQQFLACSDSTHKLYWFAHDWTMKDSVLVIDTRSDTVVARMQVDFTQRPGCFDRSGRYLFCSNPDSNTLIVYDTQSDTVAAVYATPPNPVAVVLNPELGCIYVGCADMILVYPDSPPAVADGPILAPKRPLQTILRATDVKDLNTGAWFDVTGRRVAARPAGGGGHALGPGVYLAPGAGRAAAKIVVIR